MRLRESFTRRLTRLLVHTTLNQPRVINFRNQERTNIVTQVIRLEHVGIPTSEELFEDVRDFYLNNFGWSVIREIDGPPRIAFVSDGQGGRLEVYTAEGAPLDHPAHLAFAVPDAEFDDLRQRLLDNGVTFEVERTNPSGDRMAFFKDPAGNTSQIVGRLSPLVG